MWPESRNEIDDPDENFIPETFKDWYTDADSDISDFE